jgi:hypothetical protein
MLCNLKHHHFIFIIVGYATNCFMLIIRSRDYEINFSHGNLHEILGFDKKIMNR